MRAVFSPDGKLIATAGADKTVRLWDASNGHQLAVYKAHYEMVNGVVFSPDGKVLASFGDDGKANIFATDLNLLVDWALHHLPKSIVL